MNDKDENWNVGSFASGVFLCSLGMWVPYFFVVESERDSSLGILLAILVGSILVLGCYKLLGQRLVYLYEIEQRKNGLSKYQILLFCIAGVILHQALSLVVSSKIAVGLSVFAQTATTYFWYGGDE